MSDGTTVHFTTDTSSGVVGGVEGGQGQNKTVGGETTVTIAVAPTDAGTHTVIAWTVDKNGALLSQTSQLFECSSAVAAAAPTVSAPNTGTGTNSITPPNTGDAGLADAGNSGLSFGFLAGVATTLLVFVGLSANRLCFNGRRR